jgi:hypothetical protein
LEEKLDGGEWSVEEDGCIPLTSTLDLLPSLENREQRVGQKHAFVLAPVLIVRSGKRDPRVTRACVSTLVF